MSSKRHHAEWLSLMEVSGPFLTLPVLERVFPQGLDAHDSAHARMLRLAYDEWTANQQSRRPEPAIHKSWIKLVLENTLGFPTEVMAEGQAIPQGFKATAPEYGETIRPDIVIRNPDGGPDARKPRMLVSVFSPEQPVESAVAGHRWKASPLRRMLELLYATDIQLGLVTNGEQWVLVYAPKGETTGCASWYANLWLEEPLTLRAFRSLLSAYRFFSAPADQTLEAVLAESATQQQEVTDRLGEQVRRAVEVLVESLDRADQDHKRQLLCDIPEPVLYEAALTVMMRLVFLFSAEERGLLLLSDPLYDQHYAVSTLVAQLQETADQHGEEVLERRFDAWARLLSAFRLVYGGARHDRLNVRGYGGSLFDPDRFPFLEGRRPGSSWRNTAADPLPVDNRTVLHLLRSLQFLEMQGESRRLSFRALDIEQIGHVYEGLLDHTARRATESVVSLAGAKGLEPEVPLCKLEELKAIGTQAPIDFLHDETGRSKSALGKALERTPDEVSRLRSACGNDEALLRRVLPFAGLIRDDTFGRPVVIRTGSVYVTQGSDRRTTGTHYTPRCLTEPIVEHTLDPLAFDGPAEGKPLDEWVLHSPRDLLGLRICDMACGSGAFLVQVCRYLSDRLLEAWEHEERAHPGAIGITPEGTVAAGEPGETLIPRDPDERVAYARRIVAQRCLYGVDKNPLAVEMAKLSLWLLTLSKDKPFTFLDHAIRCGDSLLGIHGLEQLRQFNLDSGAGGRSVFSAPISDFVDEAAGLRKKIEVMSADRPEDVDAQRLLLLQAEEKTARLRCAADLLVAVELQSVSRRQKDDERNAALVRAGDYLDHEDAAAFRAAAAQALDGRRTFHWPLEFPEVFAEGGFSAFVGNPPFMGGQKITGNLGTEYRDHLVEHIGSGTRGSADLCAYFYLRAASLCRRPGGFGLLATNTIAQGDTREVGLEQLLRSGWTIIRAYPSRKWPGTANLEVAYLWGRHGEWRGKRHLDDQPVSAISAFLTVPTAVTGKPYRLAANAGKSFQGSIVLGMGFVLTPEEASALIKQNAKNEDVLFPYLNGEDLNSRPDQSPSRWVINFHDWPLSRTANGSWASADEKQRKADLRSGVVPQDYTAPVAVDYPDCLGIVEQKVRPQRMKDNRKCYRDRWWQYAEKRVDLGVAIAGMERVLVTAQTSRRWEPAFCPTGVVFSHTVVVFPLSLWRHYAVVQSGFHEEWRLTYGPSLRTDARYTPSDCFETFPFPEHIALLDPFGQSYHDHRRAITQARNEGMTAVYNRFHGEAESSPDVVRLRELHVEMDKAVAQAYGWTDLSLDHGFYKTKQGVRFTVSEATRQEILSRLLALNHARYAEEVRQGLHEKKAKSTKRAAVVSNSPLFGE